MMPPAVSKSTAPTIAAAGPAGMQGTQLPVTALVTAG
jgi:hypothetical protein